MGRLLLSGASYSILGILFTYPLITRFTTHVPGVFQGDVPVNLWNLWWVRHGDSWFQTELLFAPFGVDLRLHALVLTRGLIGWLLPFDLIPTYNLLILFSFTASALSMYLLARHMTGYGWLAGLIYGFSPFMQARAMGHLNYLATEGIPLYILCLLRCREDRRWVIGAILCAVWTAYSEYYYLIYLGVFTGVYWLCSGQRRLLLRPMGWIVLGVGVGLSPLVSAWGRSGNTGLKGSIKHGADLLAFITPPAESLYPWSQAFPVETTVFAGYSVLLVGIYATWRYSSMRQWVWLTGIASILSLGPLLIVDRQFVWGRWVVPLPFTLVPFTPVLHIARVSARLDVLVMLGLALLCAQAVRKRWWIMGVVVILEFVRLPFPLSAVSVPMAYQNIQAGTVLEIPLGWHTGMGCTGLCDDRFQFYQTVHEQPLIGGFVSRLPSSTLDSLHALPVLPDILSLQSGRDKPDPARQQARAFIEAQPAWLRSHLKPLLNKPTLPRTVALGFKSQGDRLIGRTGLRYIVVHAPYMYNYDLMGYLSQTFDREPIHLDLKRVIYRVDTARR